jgi:hypothetical protein
MLWTLRKWSNIFAASTSLTVYSHGLSHYLLRSLLKNPTSGAAARERESALVFIRGVISVSSTSSSSKVLLTEGVVRTLVAIAREAGDMDDKGKDISGGEGRDPMAGVVRLIVAEIGESQALLVFGN